MRMTVYVVLAVVLSAIGAGVGVLLFIPRAARPPEENLGGPAVHAPPPPIVCPEGLRPRDLTETGEREEWCERQDGTRQGPYRKSFVMPSGKHKIVKEGSFADGQRHGAWREWWITGSKAMEGHYREGKKDGVWTYYYPTGERFRMGEHRKDLAQGKWTYWDQGGAVDKTVEFVDGKQVASTSQPTSREAP